MAIVDLHRSDVQTDIQGGVEFSFSKDAASKLYQMMSNYLYSDKEYAVVSELSANAIDAHALVGKKDTPISVQLPTRIESEFVVRDFGPGLPEHDVYRFLTAYGESSKGGTNDQIGFWGIGSKSPAAVTDTWSVISHHEGKKSHYEIFITDSGIPTLKKIFECDSDQTGLEVRVPVPSNSHSQWIAAAKRAFKHYEVRPTLNQAISYPEVKYSQSGSGWRRSVRGYIGGNIIVTMREYKLDYNKIMGEIPATSPIRLLFTGSDFANIDFIFGVGELNLSISREQIQYDKKSIDAIKAKLESVYKEFLNMIVTDLAAAKDSLDYRQRVNNWYNDGVNMKFLLNIINGAHGIQAIPRDITRFVSSSVGDLDKESIQVVSGDRMKKVTATFSCWGTNFISVSGDWVSTKASYEYKLGISIPHMDRVQVVIRDVRNAVSRIKYSGDSKTYYLLVDSSPFTGEIKTVLASSFEKPPIDYQKNVLGTLSGFYQLLGNRFLKIDEARFKEALSNPKTLAVKIGNATTAANDLTVKEPRVAFLVGLGWSLIGYKDKPPKGIKNVDQSLELLFKEMSNDGELKKIISEQSLRKMFKQVGGDNISLFAAKTKIDSAQWNDIIKPMMPVYDYFAANKVPMSGMANSYSFNTWCKLCEIMGKPTTTSGVVDLGPMIEALNNRYPLLRYINQRWYGPDADAVEAARDYITLMDSKI